MGFSIEGLCVKSSAIIRNKTWAELQVGDRASIERTCSVQDLLLFAHVSGNTNPLTLPANGDAPKILDPVAPSMWIGSLVSSLLGNLLPGPGTLYRAQNFRFLSRAHLGDRLDELLARLRPLLEVHAVDGWLDERVDSIALIARR